MLIITLQLTLLCEDGALCTRPLCRVLFHFNVPFGAWWGIYLHTSEYSTFEAFVKWNFCTFDTDTLPNDRHS